MKEEVAKLQNIISRQEIGATREGTAACPQSSNSLEKVGASNPYARSRYVELGQQVQSTLAN